ncbi:MAG: hypothetical protein AB8F74_05380 [Saprospiraceae bacterium]
MQRLILILCTILPLVGFAQEITISEEISIRNDRAYELLGQLKDRFLVFRDKPNEFTIQAYDLNMRLSWDKEIKLDGKRTQVIGTVTLDDHFYVFYTHKKKSTYYLKMHQYDAGASLVDSTTIYDYGSRPYAPRPQMVQSENKQKLLIHEFERQAELSAFSYDIEENTILWKMNFKPSDFNVYRDIYQWVFNNKGNGYFIVGLDNRKARKDSHHFRIYECKKGGVSPRVISAPLSELTYDIKFAYDNDNDKLIGGGLYSEKNRGKANGSFYLKINLENPDASLLDYAAFEPDFMSQVMEAKETQTLKGIDNVTVKKIVLRQDGGILLVAELTKEFERRLATANRGYVGTDGGRYIVDYYNDDMFIISIHPDGRRHWQSILHKKQYSQDDNAVFSSFFMMKTPSVLRFLFNDDIKNENTVSEYLVNGYGESDRNSVMSTENQDVQLRFQDALQIDSGDVIIPSERRYRLRLVKLEF